MSIVHLNKENFKSEVLEASVPVVVDFFAEWCAPCVMLGPILEELSSQYADKCKICKVNVDENPELASQYQISSIPAIFFIKNGEVVDQSLGVLPAQAFQEKIDNIL